MFVLLPDDLPIPVVERLFHFMLWSFWIVMTIDVTRLSWIGFVYGLPYEWRLSILEDLKQTYSLSFSFSDGHSLSRSQRVKYLFVFWRHPRRPAGQNERYFAEDRQIWKL